MPAAAVQCGAAGSATQPGSAAAAAAACAARSRPGRTESALPSRRPPSPRVRYGRSTGFQGGRGPGGGGADSCAPGALRPGGPDLAAAPAPRSAKAAPRARPWSHQYLLGSAGDAGEAWRGWVQSWHDLVRHGQFPRCTTSACLSPTLRAGGGGW